MPGRSQQKERELKRAAKSCSKLTDLFKKSTEQKHLTDETVEQRTDETQEEAGKKTLY